MTPTGGDRGRQGEQNADSIVIPLKRSIRGGLRKRRSAPPYSPCPPFQTPKAPRNRCNAFHWCDFVAKNGTLMTNKTAPTPAQALVTLAVLAGDTSLQGVHPWSAIGAARDSTWLICDRAKSRGFKRSRQFQANCRRGVVTPGILADAEAICSLVSLDEMNLILAVATRNHQAQA